MQILEAVSLASRSTLGVGGPAKHFVEATEESSVLDALSWCERRGVRCQILGGGSNVVVADSGFDGLVLRIATRGVSSREQGGAVELSAAAGEPWDELVALTVERGWTGLECLSGIPGQVGATPIQNVGAYGQEVSERIKSVRAFDRRDKELVQLSPEACRFSYRDSLLKSQQPERYVVLSVTYRLLPGAAPEVRYEQLEQHLQKRGIAQPTPSHVRESVLGIRREKSLLLDPGDVNGRSCGSFFTNPIVAAETLERVRQQTRDPSLPHWPRQDGRVKLSAGWLIEQAGFLRGQRSGSVGLSTEHALVLVCHEGARADDVISFARQIRTRVRERFGVRLSPEPTFWGFPNLDDGLPDERIA